MTGTNEPGGRFAGRSADDIVEEAAALAAEGAFPRAALCLEAALLVDPTHIEAIVGLARMFAELGDPSRALPLIVRAMEEQPGFLPIYALATRIGLHFRSAGAVLGIVQAGAIAREDAVEVHVWLARIYAALRQFAPLRATLRRIEEITKTPRARLLADLIDDPDLSAEAIATLQSVC
jgi:tetratricopeptide (TPR) repeat protein